VAEKKSLMLLKSVLHPLFKVYAQYAENPEKTGQRPKEIERRRKSLE
jgi:hypothetical protein